jgi:hypothetical protein
MANASANVSQLIAAALLVIAGVGFVAGISSLSAPDAGMTLGQRAQAARGGRALSDVYRDAFNADRARLGVSTLVAGGR